MGRGKRSVIASWFGFKKQGEDEDDATRRTAPPQWYYSQGRRVRPSDYDEYYGRHWYAERDIDRKAAEYIERVHRGMLGGDQDG
ncbi:hypothetical protein ACP70R_030065 [Stipagrostis hirtigluma subsp. patula]